MSKLMRELVDSFSLKSDDCIFISSDITRLALLFRSQGSSFSVPDFIAQVQAKIPDGTLIIPAYTDYLVSGDTFDLFQSKPSTGALSNKVWKIKSFARTSDPIHSVFVWGKLQAECLQLEDDHVFGEKSIFGFLDRTSAKLIFLDVPFQTSFTYVHYVERKLNVWYRKNYRLNLFRQLEHEKQSIQRIFHTKKRGVLTDLALLEQEFKASKIAQKLDFHSIAIISVSANDASVFIEKFVQSGKKLHRFSWREFFRRWIRVIFRKRGAF